MNPPFTRDQDLLHVEHALKFLAPGGILVAILLDNPQRPRFQALIERLGRIQSHAKTEESIFWFTRVPAKTFADTDVRTLILKVKLPQADLPQPDEPTPAEPPPRAFDDREQGRLVDFPTREDAQVHRDLQLSRPGGSDYATAIEKQGATRFDLVYKRKPKNLPAPETEMKINIPRQELLAAIAAVKPVARGPLPIHNNLLIVAGPGQTVTLTATDVDLFLRVKTEAEVAKEGKTTVRAILLHDIVRMADGKEVCLDLAKNVLKVNSGTTKHQLTTIDPEDFPPFPRLKCQAEVRSQSYQTDTKEPVELTLDDTVFRCALNEVSFAASTEEARGILCGTLVKLDGKQMHIAACDGRRLAACTLDAPVADKVALVIPSKAARELLRLLGQDAAKPQRLTVLAGENNASFTFASGYSSEVTLVSKIIDGQYPDYTKIIPPENAIATLPRAELLRCVERIGLVADDVGLEFNGSALHLRSAGKRGKELLGEAQDSLLVPAKVREKVECGYAARYLAAALAALADDSVEFHLNPQTRLGMFKAPGRGWRAVIAPTKKENANGAPKPAAPAAPAAATPTAPAPAAAKRPRVMVSKPTTAAPAPAPAPAATPEPPVPTQPEQAS
jgi:DNA polymerase-3 subunit beta